MADLLTGDDLPEGFAYPPEFLRVVELGLTDLEPWWIIDGDLLRSGMRLLASAYPTRRLVLFAKRQDNDDVACWDLDTACPGFADVRGREVRPLSRSRAAERPSAVGPRRCVSEGLRPHSATGRRQSG